jgi:hypothetical protein
LHLSKSFTEKNKEKIAELTDLLETRLEGSKYIEEYLDFILNEIDGLNKYFRRIKRRVKIPYSAILSFAKSDKRLSKFIFDKKLHFIFYKFSFKKIE